MNKLNKLFITLAFTALTIIAVNAQSYDDFKITTWNVEWLSCQSYGPKDRELQINNVVAVIKEMNSDFVALQEVGTSKAYTTIDTLVKRLGNDWAGNIAPWSNNNCSQNQGVVYKKSKIQLIYSSLITNGGSSYNWSSGRYPVLYDVDFTTENKRIPVAFINIHAKAYADEESYARRKNASIALKELLDESPFNNVRVVVIGDLNDYLTGTMCTSCGGVSPYKNFMDDINNYKGLTTNLIQPYYHNPVIDNIIISNELFDSYLDNSAFMEVSATQIIPNYRTTTSDHYPVSVIFRIKDEVGVVETVNSSINIYPNPTAGKLSIEISDMSIGISDIAIYDVYGRKLSQISYLKSHISNPIDISGLSAGIYFVKIMTDEGMVVTKVVKQ